MTGARSLVPAMLPLLLLLLLLLLLSTTADGAAAAIPAVSTEWVDLLGGDPESRPSSLRLEVVSSDRSCEVRLGGRLLLYRRGRPLSLHALALNPRTGRSTGHAAAPGGVPAGAFVELESFVSGVQTGRVVVLCQQSGADMALGDLSDRLFRSLNASRAAQLQARSAVALVVVKGGPVLGEAHRPNLAALEPDTPAPTLRLTVSVPVEQPACQPPAPDYASERLRREFCERYDGYGALCDCYSPQPPLPVARLLDAEGRLFPFPILVASTGRPRHLHRCLTALLANPGLDPTRLVIVTASSSGGSDGGGGGGDGEGDELRDLLRVYGVRWHPISAPPGGRGSVQRRALQAGLRLFPAADKLLILDDNVAVSPDMLSFFQQTHHLPDMDVSLFGVSAGNELGYQHTVSDRAAVYRVDSAPAGAWLLPRRLITDDILPGWETAAAGVEPELSELLRREDVRLGRECVIPEVPRFYRFAFNTSDNGTDYLYHHDRAVSEGGPVALRGIGDLTRPRYQRHLQTLISAAAKLDGEGTRLNCAEIVPRNITSPRPLLLSVRMVGAGDTAGWRRAASCLGLRDTDPRGHHVGVWRLRHAGGGPLLLLAVPFSPLAAHALLHGSGRMLLVSDPDGHPPSLRRRPSAGRVLDRYRLSAAAAGLNSTQLQEALIQRGLLQQRDIRGDDDDGDLGLQEIS